MKFISLPIQFDEKRYELNPLFGMLLELKKNNQNLVITTPKKLTEALEYCNNPFTLKKQDSISKKPTPTYVTKTLQLYSNLLININKLNFGLGRVFTVFGKPVFDNASMSISFFRNNKLGAIQNDLCLPRSLFAASTSKKFKENGVIFIGVSLPSNLMHAWIIEDGKQPDPLDTMWINFQPVAAIF